METMIYLFFTATAGLTFYVIAFSLLLVAFVLDLFLKVPETVAFFCRNRGFVLLRATSALCLLAMLFVMNAPSEATILMFLQTLIAAPLAQASFNSELFRPERVAILYRLLWVTIPMTFGAGVISDIQHTGSWWTWFTGPIFRALLTG